MSDVALSSWVWLTWPSRLAAKVFRHAAAVAAAFSDSIKWHSRRWFLFYSTSYNSANWTWLQFILLPFIWLPLRILFYYWFNFTFSFLFCGCHAKWSILIRKTFVISFRQLYCVSRFFGWVFHCLCILICQRHAQNVLHRVGRMGSCTCELIDDNTICQDMHCMMDGCGRAGIGLVCLASSLGWHNGLQFKLKVCRP